MRLTELFQQIRYGGQPETSESTSSALDAYESLRQYWGDS
jgi:hypothetical protein